MVQSIQYRERIGLGEPEWQGDTWVTITDFEQRLYDRGLRVGALLNDVDALGKVMSNPENLSIGLDAVSRMERVQPLIKTVGELDDALETWYKKLADYAQGPLYWDEETSDPQSPPSATITFLGSPNRRISFPNLRMCHMLLDYWGLHNIVSSVISTIFAKLPLHIQTLPPLSPFKARVERHSLPFVLEQCTRIVDAAPYSLRTDMGLCGAQRSMFGVRVAMLCFRMFPGEYAASQLIKCEGLMEQMAEEKGLEFARDLANISGRWEGAPERKTEARSQVYYWEREQGGNVVRERERERMEAVSRLQMAEEELRNREEGYYGFYDG